MPNSATRFEAVCECPLVMERQVAHAQVAPIGVVVACGKGAESHVRKPDAHHRAQPVADKLAAVLRKQRRGRVARTIRVERPPLRRQPRARVVLEPAREDVALA